MCFVRRVPAVRSRRPAPPYIARISFAPCRPAFPRSRRAPRRQTVRRGRRRRPRRSSRSSGTSGRRISSCAFSVHPSGRARAGRPSTVQRRIAGARVVVGERAVVRAALVPDRDVARAPAPPHVEVRILDVAVQAPRNTIALVGVHPSIAVMKAPATKSAVASGLRMGAHERVYDRRELSVDLARDSSPGRARNGVDDAAPTCARHAAGGTRLHRPATARRCCVEARPHRVAAALGDLRACRNAILGGPRSR